MTVNEKVSRKTDEWDMVTGLNMGLTAELLAQKGELLARGTRRL